MNLSLRAPQPGEWPICRMLLPETFADASRREYLLCLNDESPRIAGAASFVRLENALTQLRLHVVPPLRRRGIASWIVSQLAAGVRSLQGVSEITAQPAVPPFCERNLFRRTDALTTVEGEIAEMRSFLQGLRARIPTSLDLSVIPLSAAPAAEVAQLHAQYVAHQSNLDPWRALLAATPGMAVSPVVMQDRHAVGILLGEIEGEIAVVRSRVAAPGPHARWVNLLLLSHALDIAWSAGAHRARFTYTDTNHDTQKLAARFRAEVKSVLVEYTREGECRPPLYLAPAKMNPDSELDAYPP